MGLSNIIKNATGRFTRSRGGTAVGQPGTGRLNASGTGGTARPSAGGIAGKIRNALRRR
jgi:hypothetical protein